MSKTLVCIFLMRLAASFAESFIFNGFSGANLSLNGLAGITPEGLLRLTNDTKEAKGHGFYPIPLHFKNTSNGTPLSFYTTFVFVIVPEYPDVSGHGISFAISPTKELSESMPSQFLGLFSITNNGNPMNHVIAVELDTVKTTEFRDINDNHVGIDINDLHSVNSTPVGYFDEISGSWKSLKLISADPMQVWVDYDGMDEQLEVRISPLGVPKPKRKLLSSKVNLSAIALNDMFVGFSSSTGAATGSHYVLGWSFSMHDDAQALDLSQLPSVPLQGATKESSQVLRVALPLAAVIVLLLSIGGAIFIFRRRKRFGELIEDWEAEFRPHRFSYKELFKATKGFKEENLLGFGGFGRVYKGVLPSSKLEIAVKKISHESGQGMKEFISEIVSMGRLRHRNLVQLLGYSRRQGELLLVYEFMPNGSLDRFIFDDRKTSLTWSQRLQVIKGVASGLLYLHEGWEQLVIHRDIKASNILLDAELNAKLSDFGLARLYDHGSNPQTTHIVGTLGYLAPELSKTGKATKSVDVYAFGAFLLEVACGRRPIDPRSSVEFPHLVDFVIHCWKRGMILEARDPKLGYAYQAKEMELVLKLGLLCCHPEPMSRPSMRQVMHFLEGDITLPLATPDGLTVSASEAMQFDDCFDNITMSFTSKSDTTFAPDTSSVSH